MEETGTKSTGHFTQAARARTPRGVSPKEGWLILIQASGIAAFLAITFQSRSWEWGGIIHFLAVGVFGMFTIMVTHRMAMTRRVHPLGHKHRNILAGILPVLTALIGGWFWTVPPGHDTSWVITTAVAVLSCLPLAAVGLRQGIRRSHPDHAHEPDACRPRSLPAPPRRPGQDHAGTDLADTDQEPSPVPMAGLAKTSQGHHNPRVPFRAQSLTASRQLKLLKSRHSKLQVTHVFTSTKSVT